MGCDVESWEAGAVCACVDGHDGVDEGLFGFWCGKGAWWVIDLPERHDVAVLIDSGLNEITCEVVAFSPW